MLKSSSKLSSSKAVMSSVQLTTVPPRRPPKPESRARVLKKRAKRKAAHIARLKAKPDYNPLIGLVNPDPDRWVPRKQKLRGRARRQNQKFGGAQGSGIASSTAAKDIAKLDAAARAMAKKAAPTTGVVVSSGQSAMERKAAARKRR
jgi:hypothetical protein